MLNCRELRASWRITIRRLRRRGFTLVELLIAMALMTLLMAGLWSMFGVYARVLEKSERRVTRSQLTRSLQDQLRSDLRVAQVSFENSDQTKNEDIAATRNSALGGTDHDDLPNDKPSLSPENDLDRLEGELMSNDSMQSNLAFEITDDKWHDPQIEFFGNAHGLIVQSQIVDGDSVPIQELEQLDHENNFANPTPNTLKRTIYFYLDDEDAKTHGFPNGLLRMEFTAAQLHALPQQMDSNLFGLIEMLQPEWFQEPENAQLPHEDQHAISENLAEEFSEHELREEENRFKNLKRKIDFLPEVKAFRLRYYDGFAWQSTWDAGLAQSLPVAVEVSFDIELRHAEQELVNPSEMDAVDAAILENEQASREANDDLGEMAMGLDDEIRSSQTMDIVPPNRFLIFLRPVHRDQMTLVGESGSGRRRIDEGF